MCHLEENIAKYQPRTYVKQYIYFFFRKSHFESLCSTLTLQCLECTNTAGSTVDWLRERIDDLLAVFLYVVRLTQYLVVMLVVDSETVGRLRHAMVAPWT